MGCRTVLLTIDAGDPDPTSLTGPRLELDAGVVGDLPHPRCDDSPLPANEQWTQGATDSWEHLLPGVIARINGVGNDVVTPPSNVDSSIVLQSFLTVVWLGVYQNVFCFPEWVDVTIFIFQWVDEVLGL